MRQLNSNTWAALFSFSHQNSWLTGLVIQIAAAWETLSDASKRREYDVSRAASPPAANTQKQQTATNSANDAGKEQRERKASAAKRRAWLNWMSRMDRKIANTRNKVNKLAAEIETLDRLDREQERKLRGGSWWRWTSRPVFTDEEMRVMEAATLERLAARRIKQSRLERATRLLDAMKEEQRVRTDTEDARVEQEEMRRRRREEETIEKEEGGWWGFFEAALEELAMATKEDEAQEREAREAEEMAEYDRVRHAAAAMFQLRVEAQFHFHL